MRARPETETKRVHDKEQDNKQEHTRLAPARRRVYAHFHAPVQAETLDEKDNLPLNPPPPPRHTTSNRTEQSRRLVLKKSTTSFTAVAGQKPHKSWTWNDILKRVYLSIGGLNANVRGVYHSACHFIL